MLNIEDILKDNNIKNALIDCIKREGLVGDEIDELDIEIYLQYNFEFVESKTDYFTKLAIEILEEKLPNIFIDYKKDYLAVRGYLDRFFAFGFVPKDTIQDIIDNMNLKCLRLRNGHMLIFKNYNTKTYYLDDILESFYWELFSENEYDTIINNVITHFYPKYE